MKPGISMNAPLYDFIKTAQQEQQNFDAVGFIHLVSRGAHHLRPDVRHSVSVAPHYSQLVDTRYIIIPS